MSVREIVETFFMTFFFYLLLLLLSFVVRDLYIACAWTLIVQMLYEHTVDTDQHIDCWNLFFQ